MSADAGRAPVHLGLVVYCWGQRPQNRLLVDGLAPAVAELRRGALRHFWFSRFDARGPHVMALFTIPAAAREPTRAALARRVADHLAAHPSRVALGEEELAARHEACRGKALCELDALPGLAANNTFAFFAQPSDGYPFALGHGAPREDELWQAVDGLTAWTLEELGRDPDALPITAAVRLAAALHGALPAHLPEPRAYWRYHATTLLGAGRGDDVDRRLRRTVEAAHRAGLAEAWDLAAELGPPWTPLPWLVELALEAGAARRRPWAPLREVVHGALKQLGVPVKLQIPLVALGWSRSS